MRNIKSKGFGLIGLLITIAIIVFLVVGYKGLNGQSQKNQIEEGQNAIQQAHDAADKENQNTEYIQNQIQDQPTVNYHGVLDNAKNLK